MMVRLMFGAALLLLLAAAGWSLRQSEAVRGWLHPRDPRAPAITFDNGSVRQAASAASDAAVPIKAPGGFRKCRKGKTVVYTDRSCPEGTLEEAVAKGTLTVLPAQTPAASTARGAAKPADAMDLREKRIERIINP